MKLFKEHYNRAQKRLLSAKGLSFVNKCKIIGAVVTLPLFIIGFLIYIFIPKLPLYALNARLKDFTSFQTRLDSFEFDTKNEVRLDKLVIYKDGKIITDRDSTQWEKVTSTINWNKVDNIFNTSGMNMTPDEGRESWMLLDPRVIQSALNARKYSITDTTTDNGVITEIRIPGEQVKDNSIETYIKGIEIANRLLNKRQKSCFFGAVKNLSLDKISSSGVITGDLVFTIEHKKWDIAKIEEPYPTSITVFFHGDLCIGGDPVTGYYTSSTSSDTMMVKTINPKHDFTENTSGFAIYDLMKMIWKMAHYK